MKRNHAFEWQTDKEEGWDALPPRTAAKTKSWKIRLILPVALLLLLTVVGIVFYLQINRRVQSATNRLQDELLASHELLNKAILDDDGELFESLLFPDDTRWYKLQIALQARHLFLERAPLGLWIPSGVVQAAAQPLVDLSPDLTRGVVVEHQPYVIGTSQGVTETILLERTLTYRLVDDHWLLASPSDVEEFWGNWLWQEGNSLKLSYPARDAEIGRRLFTEFEELISRLCQEPDLSCPESFKLQLRLSRSPDSILQLQEVRNGLSAGSYHMDLPAPSWVGRPLDEAGYQALYRGYAGWLATALVEFFSGRQLVDNQTLDRYLKPMGLTTPALPSSLPLQDRRPPPLPWPDQDIMLLCDSFQLAHLLRYDPSAETWQDYSEATDGTRLSTVLRNSSPSILPLPDDSGILAQVRQADAGEPLWRIYTWRNGRERLLAEATSPYSMVPLYIQNQIDPTWQRMIFYEDSATPDGTIPFSWIDLSDCPDAPCQLRPADGLPLWSADLQQTLLTRLTDDGRSTLLHGDDQARADMEIGPGALPYWIDDQIFAYVRPQESRPDGAVGPGAGFELLISSLTLQGEPADTPAVWLDTQALLAAVPSQLRPGQLWIRLISYEYAASGSILIWGTAADEFGIGTDFIFSYDIAEHDVSLRLELSQDRLTDPWVASDHGQIALITTGSGGWSLSVFDLGSDELVWQSPQRNFKPLFDWAAGGQWLALIADDFLKLVAPNHSYEKAIVHNLSGCRSVAWINR